MEDLDFKKAKTRKGKKILKDREPKAVEGPKKTIFLKGNKTSEKVNSAMKSLVRILKRERKNESNNSFPITL